jgi:hypothetical protein
MKYCKLPWANLEPTKVALGILIPSDYTFLTILCIFGANLHSGCVLRLTDFLALPEESPSNHWKLSPASDPSSTAITAFSHAYYSDRGKQHSVLFCHAAIANGEANHVALGSTSNSSITIIESHSSFLDESKLMALTTHLHMLVMLEYLIAKRPDN